MKVCNIKWLGICLFFCYWVNTVSAVPGTPLQKPQDESRLGSSNELRFFIRNENLTYVANVKVYFEKEFKKGAVTLGTYYSPMANLKTGLLYRASVGEMHDDDWIKGPLVWEWQDTRNRTEHNLILDLTPRMVLNMLINENCIGEWKTRYIYNFYNNQQTVTFRPGISYFWMKKDVAEPLLSVYLQDEIYWALNYGKPLYANQVYSGLLYHFNEFVQLGLTVSYYTSMHGSSSQYKAKFDDTYWKKYDTVSFGLLFLYKI